MVLAGWLTKDPTPILRSDRLLLRAARHADYHEWRNIRLSSRAFLKPYEPRWTEADLSRAVFRMRLNRGRTLATNQSEYSFLIFDVANKSPQLVGGLTLSNIRRRVAQQVNLGYWMGEAHTGRGVMSHAVGMVLPFIFSELGLHRVNAACLAHNIASRRVLEKNGFREEGYAEGYLFIDGKWQDHVLYGLTRERFETFDLRL